MNRLITAPIPNVVSHVSETAASNSYIACRSSIPAGDTGDTPCSGPSDTPS
jgi:hypothetical protein